MTGSDGNARAAKVQVISPGGKQLIRRPLQHLIPLEITTNINDLRKQQPAKDAHVQESRILAVNAAAQRPKRNAAIIGILRRKDGLLK